MSGDLMYDLDARITRLEQTGPSRHVSLADLQRIEQRINELKVLCDTVSSKRTTTPEQVRGDIARLEKKVEDQLHTLKHSLLDAVASAMHTEQKREKAELQALLRATASASAEHARAATDLARVNLDAAVDVLKAAGWTFAHATEETV